MSDSRCPGERGRGFQDGPQRCISFGLGSGRFVLTHEQSQSKRSAGGERGIQLVERRDGPKVGSVDPGYGTAFLARVVGEKKAREIWYLCRRYKAPEALAMGLVNAVVPHDQLDAEVQKWCDEIMEKSPTAIAIAKRSFNMDTAHQAGIAGMGMYALKLYYDTEESREGVKAFNEKRKPEFRKYVK